MNENGEDMDAGMNEDSDRSDTYVSFAGDISINIMTKLILLDSLIQETIDTDYDYIKIYLDNVW